LSNYRLLKLILTIIVGGSPIVGAERMLVFSAAVWKTVVTWNYL
jgi:hypothetical protein